MRGAIPTIIVAWAMLLGLCAISPAFAQTAREADSGEPVSIEELVEDHTSNRRIQSERPEFKPDIPERQPRQRNSFLEAIAKFFAWVFTTFGGLLKVILMRGLISRSWKTTARLPVRPPPCWNVPMRWPPRGAMPRRSTCCSSGRLRIYAAAGPKAYPSH